MLDRDTIPSGAIVGAAILDAAAASTADPPPANAAAERLERSVPS
jgi:hypothetical protein